jgi:hypothetical protein
VAPLWSTTTKDIQAELGVSTALYFAFLKYISVLFAVMTLVSLPAMFLMVRTAITLAPTCFQLDFKFHLALLVALGDGWQSFRVLPPLGRHGPMIVSQPKPQVREKPTLAYCFIT